MPNPACRQCRGKARRKHGLTQASRVHGHGMLGAGRNVFVFRFLAGLTPRSECIPGDDEFKNEAAFQSSSSTAPVPAPKKVIQYTKGGLQTSSTFTIGVPVQLKKSMAAMAAAEAVATQRCAIEAGGAVADAKSNRTIAGGCCSEVSQARRCVSSLLSVQQPTPF